ncbi:MAG: excinuclease ABC subunit UvrB [Calditrichaeota bacterium]|nr:excinuclease ABC subunit UvrB [Calditrichota bacterium]
MDQFKIVSQFQPSGDQPEAINELVDGLNSGKKHQVLLGATGTGKTFTMANVIERVNRPTLILCHNKTLAAQLFGEFKQFFPDNAVEFFISFYDYYQPEAYMPTTDTYIEKDSSINDEIDRLRLKATSSLLERRDVIVIASVSSIYGLGSPVTYKESMIMLVVGQEYDRKDLFESLIDMQYIRNDFDFQRGTFRVRGDVLEVFPAYDTLAIQFSFYGDEIEAIHIVNPVTGELVAEKDRSAIFPAKHFLSVNSSMDDILEQIQDELREQIALFNKQNKLIEAQRIEQRVSYDVEMLREIGYCSGIENYSRFFDGRNPGERPFCLFDFFPDDYLLIIDESHQTIPQIRAMYFGDRNRKETLVDYGFRLPAAIDNRPLTFEEFEKLTNQVVYISATPAPYELTKTSGEIVEQVIRPTGLLDPGIDIRPIKGQIDDLIHEIRENVKKNERVLVTTLTKRMSEDLSDYLRELGIKVRYLHSEIDAIQRVELLRDLRLGNFDVLVGINLLREGLDLPEVSLVAILDADKEGFLRSRVSLLQTVGRAARNSQGRVIMYADKITDSMRFTIDETNRRREKQVQHNTQNQIEPKTVRKSKDQIVQSTSIADMLLKANKISVQDPGEDYMTDEIVAESDPRKKIKLMEKEMKEAAEQLQFEKAARLRDEIAAFKEMTNV